MDDGFMFHAGMSSNGKRWAALFGLVVALALPISVECGVPGAECAVAGKFRTVCKSSELEPLGFYFLESVLHRNVGFAYTRTVDCR